MLLDSGKCCLGSRARFCIVCRVFAFREMFSLVTNCLRRGPGPRKYRFIIASSRIVSRDIIPSIRIKNNEIYFSLQLQ